LRRIRSRYKGTGAKAKTVDPSWGRPFFVEYLFKQTGPRALRPAPASLSFANAQKKVTKEKGVSPAAGMMRSRFSVLAGAGVMTIADLCGEEACRLLRGGHCRMDARDLAPLSKKGGGKVIDEGLGPVVV
jgi:hypothetical protein